MGREFLTQRTRRDRRGRKDGREEKDRGIRGIRGRGCGRPPGGGSASERRTKGRQPAQAQSEQSRQSVCLVAHNWVSVLVGLPVRGWLRRLGCARWEDLGGRAAKRLTTDFTDRS